MRFITTEGKSVTIPNAEIQQLMDSLKISKIEAVHTWLADNDLEINEEQEKLDNLAKKVKISKDTAKKRTKSDKPRTVKVSDEKKGVFDAILEQINDYCLKNGGKCEVLKENKLISVEIGEKILKIDLIEARPQKK